MLNIPKAFPSALLKKKQVAKDVYSLYFSRSSEDFNFLPGQYIRISLPIKDKIISHFFTIASSPLEKNHIMVTIKIRESDFKQSLLHLKDNEKIALYGPLGGFYFDQNDTREKVFLAGGIGITPFYSMIVYIAKKKVSVPVTLIASFSSVEEIIYYDELMRLSKEFKNIKIIFTITQSNTAWKGEIGRISERLIKKYISDITKPMYYIVGSGEMVTATEELLESMHIPLEQIKIESFTGY